MNLTSQELLAEKNPESKPPVAFKLRVPHTTPEGSRMEWMGVEGGRGLPPLSNGVSFALTHKGIINSLSLPPNINPPPLGDSWRQPNNELGFIVWVV